MERIYDQAKDIHVATYVLYAKTADKKLYLESSYTTQVTKAELEDAFKKGRLLIFDGTNYLVAISMAGGKVKTVGMGASAVELTEWSANINT